MFFRRIPRRSQWSRNHQRTSSLRWQRTALTTSTHLKKTRRAHGLSPSSSTASCISGSMLSVRIAGRRNRESTETWTNNEPFGNHFGGCRQDHRRRPAGSAACRWRRRSYASCAARPMRGGGHPRRSADAVFVIGSYRRTCERISCRRAFAYEEADDGDDADDDERQDHKNDDVRRGAGHLGSVDTRGGRRGHPGLATNITLPATAISIAACSREQLQQTSELANDRRRPRCAAHSFPRLAARWEHAGCWRSRRFHP